MAKYSTYVKNSLFKGGKELVSLKDIPEGKTAGWIANFPIFFPIFPIFFPYISYIFSIFPIFSLLFPLILLFFQNDASLRSGSYRRESREVIDKGI